MPRNQPLTDVLEARRATHLYEWTFALVFANYTIHLYRLFAQTVTFVFDVFSLRYSVDLFWPLTTDDLKPYHQDHKATRYELIFKIFEGICLTISGFAGAWSLIEFYFTGLAVYLCIFMFHIFMIASGSFYADKSLRMKFFSLEFAIWLCAMTIEVSCVILVAVFLVYYGILNAN